MFLSKFQRKKAQDACERNVGRNTKNHLMLWATIEVAVWLEDRASKDFTGIKDKPSGQRIMRNWNIDSKC